MSSLIITKQSGNFFSLVLDGGSPIISEQNRLTTIGNYCNFKTANGANLILKQNVLYSEITIIDGGSYVPTSINDLWVSLIDVGFFNGVVIGGSVTATEFTELLDTFTSYIGRDGQILVVNESEQRIETIGISIFSEADREKLDGIETGAEVNVQSDWNESDPDSDAFILNKPDLSGNSSALIVLDGGIVLTAPQQDFELPDGAICQNVFVNESLVTNTTNTAFVARWNQDGTTVTLSKTTATNNRVVIQYILP